MFVEPSVGVRNPDLRSLDSGTSIHGDVADRRAQEIEGCVVARADVAGLVDFELAHPDVPVVAGRYARRVARVGRFVTVGTGEADLRRAATRAVLADVEAR